MVGRIRTLSCLTTALLAHVRPFVTPMKQLSRPSAVRFAARRPQSPPGGFGLARLMATRAGETEAQAGPAAAVEKLRETMKGLDVDAFIVPTDDPHLSEYPPECFARREFISGFTGSAGTAVITRDDALLWTDGRYFLQAEEELPEDWTLMKSGQPGVPTLQKWLADTFGGASPVRVAIDPFVHSATFAETLKKDLEAKGHTLVTLDSNPVDGVWDAQPERPSGEIRLHPLEYAGKSVSEKLAEVRTLMAEKGAEALAVGMLDEVAWLFNVRGADIAFNPVALAYGLVTAEGATLFISGAKVPEAARAALEAEGVAIEAYEGLIPALSAAVEEGKKVWVDEARVNFACANVVPKASRASGVNPVTMLKAVKNAAELKGMRDAHERDAVALVRFMAWMHRTIADEGHALTEVEVDEALTGRFRAEVDGFLEPSFPTIAGAGPNGAIIHYRADGPDCGIVGPGTVLLLDSGGQYLDGTTDCTRTMVFGDAGCVPARVKETFTRVLQGNIAVDAAVFPEGTPGFVLDVLARRALWSAGQDYAHGTGHGVGAALNVHEGPQSISPRFQNTQALAPGMVLSNEPGFYEPKAFGIRTENLLVVEEVPDMVAQATGKQFLRFRSLTVVPINKALIVKDMLTQEELNWLNDYHKRVFDTVSPHLSREDKDWLEAACAPL